MGLTLPVIIQVFMLKLGSGFFMLREEQKWKQFQTEIKKDCLDLRTKWDGKNHKLETSIYTVHFVFGLKVKWVMYVAGISEIRVSDVLVGKYERQNTSMQLGELC